MKSIMWRTNNQLQSGRSISWRTLPAILALFLMSSADIVNATVSRSSGPARDRSLKAPRMLSSSKEDLMVKKGRSISSKTMKKGKGSKSCSKSNSKGSKGGKWEHCDGYDSESEYTLDHKYPEAPAISPHVAPYHMPVHDPVPSPHVGPSSWPAAHEIPTVHSPHLDWSPSDWQPHSPVPWWWSPVSPAWTPTEHYPTPANNAKRELIIKKKSSRSSKSMKKGKSSKGCRITKSKGSKDGKWKHCDGDESPSEDSWEPYGPSSPSYDAPVHSPVATPHAEPSPTSWSSPHASPHSPHESPHSPHAAPHLYWQPHSPVWWSPVSPAWTPSQYYPTPTARRRKLPEELVKKKSYRSSKSMKREKGSKGCKHTKSKGSKGGKLKHCDGDDSPSEDSRQVHHPVASPHSDSSPSSWPSPHETPTVYTPHSDWSPSDWQPHSPVPSWWWSPVSPAWTPTEHYPTPTGTYKARGRKLPEEYVYRKKTKTSSKSMQKENGKKRCNKGKSKGSKGGKWKNCDEDERQSESSSSDTAPAHSALAYPHETPTDYTPHSPVWWSPISPAWTPTDYYPTSTDVAWTPRPTPGILSPGNEPEPTPEKTAQPAAQQPPPTPTPEPTTEMSPTKKSAGSSSADSTTESTPRPSDEIPPTNKPKDRPQPVASGSSPPPEATPSQTPTEPTSKPSAETTLPKDTPQPVASASSPEPTSDPTQSPTKAPTSKPSAETTPPKDTPQPVASASSPKPSSDPTQSPTKAPTKAPTETTLPKDTPQPVASASSPEPTSDPTQSPTKQPSAEPTVASMPVADANWAPHMPFWNPVWAPAWTPAYSPSVALGQDSQLPTIAIDNVVTETTRNGDEIGLLSSCEDPSQASSNSYAKTLSFYYAMTVDAGTDDIEGIVPRVEDSLHFLLAEKLLTCSSAQDSRGNQELDDLDVSYLSSLPEDELATIECPDELTTDSLIDCHIVTGRFTIYFLPTPVASDLIDGMNLVLEEAMNGPSARRRNLDQDKLLSADPRLIDLYFIGFIDETPAEAIATDSGSLDGDNSTVSNGAVVGAVSLAAVAVIAVLGGFLVFQRRRMRARYYHDMSMDVNSRIGIRKRPNFSSSDQDTATRMSTDQTVESGNDFSSALSSAFSSALTPKTRNESEDVSISLQEVSGADLDVSNDNNGEPLVSPKLCKTQDLARSLSVSNISYASSDHSNQSNPMGDNAEKA